MGIFQDFIDNRSGFRSERIALRELKALRDRGDPLAPSGFENRTGWAILKVLGLTDLATPPPLGDLIGYLPKEVDYLSVPISPTTALVIANQIAIDDGNSELEEELIIHLDLIHYLKKITPQGLISTILQTINAGLWLKPTLGFEGFNAVTNDTHFTLTGVASSSIGPGGQEILDFTGTQRLVNDGTLVGVPYTSIPEDAKFWIYFYIHPRGNTGFQTIACNGPNVSGIPGFRILFKDGLVTFRISDGVLTHNINISAQAPYSASKPHAILLNVDLENYLLSGYYDGTCVLLASQNRMAILPLSTFPIVPAKPLILGSGSHTSQDLPLDSEFMIAMGTGLVPDKLATDITRIGIGQNFATVSNYNPEAIITQRNIVHSATSFSVTGKYAQPVHIRLFENGIDDVRGTFISGSTILTPDSLGRATHTFTGLTAGTKYHIITTAGSVDDLSESRMTTPIVARHGAKFAFIGDLIRPLNLIQSSIDNEVLAQFEQGRVVITTGDDGYLDTAHQRLNNLPIGSNPVTLADFNAAETDEYDQFQMMPMFQRFPFTPGTWSDHDAFGDDLDGSAPNKAIAQSFHRLRFGSTLTFAHASQTYRSFVLNGCRFIVTDSRSERINGSQMLDSTQKTWIGSEIASAVAASEVIFLMLEQPINRISVPAVDWQALPAERTEVWDLVIDNGGKDQTVIVCGDYHARGINLAAGPFGTDGVTTLPVILSGRLFHTSPASADVVSWPDYFQNSQYGYMKVDILESLPSVTVRVTPVLEVTPAIPVDIVLTI